MPLFDEYAEQLKSEIADLMNTGGRPAGAITAAMFLKEFTGGLPWAHLDIAGTAWAEEAKPYQPKGPTGVAVRTLAELAFTARVVAAMIQAACSGRSSSRSSSRRDDPTGLADVLIGALGLTGVARRLRRLCIGDR